MCSTGGGGGEGGNSTIEAQSQCNQWFVVQLMYIISQLKALGNQH